MCTLLIFHRTRADYPLVIAANRDELYARPTRPPRRLAEAPPIIGGVDVEAGGTWMGATAAGLFVGITNQRDHRGNDPSLSSRGQVVLETLRSGTRAGAREHLESLDPRRYNSFNLLYGDADGLEVAYARRDADRIEIETVPEGLSVLPNDRLESAEFPKVARARRLAEGADALPWPQMVTRLRHVLADHHTPPLEHVPRPPPGSVFSHEVARRLQAICIHTPSYGTRSVTIAALAAERTAHYLYADGPPCRTAPREVTDLLG